MLAAVQLMCLRSGSGLCTIYFTVYKSLVPLQSQSIIPTRTRTLQSAFIPVTCRVVKRQSEFDGSWTIFDSGLMDDLSRETYEAFARDIEDTTARNRRMRKVGLWSLQLAAQALFIGLAGQLA